MTGPKAGERLGDVTNNKRLQELAPFGEMACRVAGCGAICMVSPISRQALYMAEMIDNPGDMSRCTDDCDAILVPVDQVTRPVPK